MNPADNDSILMPPPAPRFKQPIAIAESGYPFCVSPDDYECGDNVDDSKNQLESPLSDDDIARDGTIRKRKVAEYDSPRASFRDIIGQGQAKLRLDEALLPLALPNDLAETVLTGIRAAPASILLHGPPGCGKTKLARALAGEARAAFLSVGPSDILSKFVGESEASIRGLFREARKRARKIQSKCAVVFFDEIDALGRSRVDEESGNSKSSGDNSSRRILAELLIQMTELSNGNNFIGEENEEDDDDEYDGIGDTDISSLNGGAFDKKGNNIMSPSVSRTLISSSFYPSNILGEKDNLDRTDASSSSELDKPYDDSKSLKARVIVVAATNRPEDCDPALLRRFAVRVLVDLPTNKDRKKIIQRLLSDVEHNITPDQLKSLALATEGWSGSDLESMTREAVMAPIRETLRSTAILKKKASKGVQQNGAESSQREIREDHFTSEFLWNGFRNLRPVSCKDFEDGMAFFLGDQESIFSDNGDGKRRSVYDSSDSSDVEE